MKILVLVILLGLTSGHALAQEELRMEKSFGGVRFYQGSNLLKPREVLEIMKNDEGAYKEFKKAKSNYDAGMALSYVGGFMIGWPLGTAIGGGDPQWGIAAGGLAIVLATIPLNVGFKKHAKNALEIYNGGNKSSRLQTNINASFYGSGVRIRITFN